MEVSVRVTLTPVCLDHGNHHREAFAVRGVRVRVRVRVRVSVRVRVRVRPSKEATIGPQRP